MCLSFCCLSMHCFTGAALFFLLHINVGVIYVRCNGWPTNVNLCNIHNCFMLCFVTNAVNKEVFYSDSSCPVSHSQNIGPYDNIPAAVSNKHQILHEAGNEILFFISKWSVLGFYASMQIAIQLLPYFQTHDKLFRQVVFLWGKKIDLKSIMSTKIHSSVHPSSVNSFQGHNPAGANQATVGQSRLYVVGHKQKNYNNILLYWN